MIQLNLGQPVDVEGIVFKIKPSYKPWIGLQILDYYDIVKNPMDLGTVKKNLKTNKYKICGRSSS